MLVFLLAERTRFELVVGLLLRQFSKLVVSATHPPLHERVFVLYKNLSSESDAKLELFR